MGKGQKKSKLNLTNHATDSAKIKVERKKRLQPARKSQKGDWGKGGHGVIIQFSQWVSGCGRENTGSTET